MRCGGKGRWEGEQETVKSRGIGEDEKGREGEREREQDREREKEKTMMGWRVKGKGHRAAQSVMIIMGQGAGHGVIAGNNATECGVGL